MKRIFFLFLCVAMVAWCSPGFAAQQPVGAGATLNAAGVAEGVTFTVPGTLTVDGTGGFANIGKTAGVSATNNAINQGIIAFSVNSVVSGSLGDNTNTLADVQVNAGATTVTFNGAVYAVLMKVNTGTAVFNDGSILNKAAVTFTGDGTINVSANTKVTGALNDAGANTGTLNLYGAASGTDQWTGAVGVAGMKSINVVGGSNTAGIFSKITGAVNTYNLGLNTNTLNIAGSLTLHGSSIINTTIASATVYGKVVPTGNTTEVGGFSVNVTVPNGSVIATGTLFNIVDATSGTGNIPVVVTLAPGTNPLYTFTAANTTAGLVQLKLTGSPEAAPVVNPPADPLVPVAAGVATALQNTPQTADIIGVRAAINALTNPIDVVHAEAQLAPSTPALTAPLVTFQGQRQFQTLWLSRLDMCQPSTLYKQASNAQSGVSSGDEMEGVGDGVWVKGFGYLGHQDARGTFVEYNMRTYGVMAAYDKPLGLNTRAGLGLGYAWSRIKERPYDASTEFNTYDAVAYIGHDMGPWFVHGSLTFGWNEYSDRRHIEFTGVDRTAEADHNGQDYTAFFNTGYRFSVKKFMITPVASLQYTYSRMESYTEEGAGDLNLKVDSQDYNFVQSGLGFKVERELTYQGKSIIPEMHFRWLHMLNNPKLEQTAAFLPEGAPSFKTPGLRTSRETYNAGLGCTLFTRICRPVSWSLEGVYDYDWRTDGFYSHMATARVTLRY